MHSARPGPQGCRATASWGRPPHLHFTTVHIPTNARRVYQKNMRVSYAPNPSIYVTVTSGSISVNPCNACATHAHPARLVVAHWYGLVALSTAGLNSTSPATMPLTSTPGLDNAVILPTQAMLMTASRTCPLAIISEIWNNRCSPRTSALCFHCVKKKKLCAT